METTSKRVLPERWRELMHEGWVNVTSLPTVDNNTEPGKMCYQIFPYADFHECGAHNNSVAVHYLNDGSVWLKIGGRPNCTRYGAFVPCSNGEHLHSYHILRRIADPFWAGDEVCDYEKEGHPGLGFNEYPPDKEGLENHPAFLKAKARGIERGSLSCR